MCAFERVPEDSVVSLSIVQGLLTDVTFLPQTTFVILIFQCLNFVSVPAFPSV